MIQATIAATCLPSTRARTRLTTARFRAARRRLHPQPQPQPTRMQTAPCPHPRLPSLPPHTAFSRSCQPPHILLSWSGPPLLSLSPPPLRRPKLCSGGKRKQPTVARTPPSHHAPLTTPCILHTQHLLRFFLADTISTLSQSRRRGRSPQRCAPPPPPLLLRGCLLLLRTR
jgi:hypothetical protein